MAEKKRFFVTVNLYGRGHGYAAGEYEAETEEEAKEMAWEEAYDNVSMDIDDVEYDVDEITD